jgi:hypothetical protein
MTSPERKQRGKCCLPVQGPTNDPGDMKMLLQDVYEKDVVSGKGNGVIPWANEACTGD